MITSKLKNLKDSMSAIKSDAEEYIMNEFLESMMPKVNKLLPKVLPKVEKQLIEYLDDRMILIKKDKNSNVEVFVMKQSKMTLSPKQGEDPKECIEAKSNLDELIKILLTSIK